MRQVTVAGEHPYDVLIGRGAQARLGLLLAVNPRAMLRTLLEQRAPLYAEVATSVVPTGGRTPADVVADVLAALPAEAGR